MNKQDFIEYFVKTFGTMCSKDTEVFISKKPIDLKNVRDTQGHIFNILNLTQKSYLFFVNPFPHANWAHQCSFCFISADKKHYMIYAGLPPDETIELEKINLQDEKVK